MSLGLREWTPSFMRKLHLRHFPAAFCKHPCACKCCFAHTQHTQHTGHAAVVHLQEYVASYLWPELCGKTSVNGYGVAQIGLQSPGLMPCATGDSPATRSELWLRKLHCGASGPAACRREKGQQAFSQRLAQMGPAALISAWLPGIPWKSASHYTFLDQELKLGFFVLSHSTSIGLFCVCLSL